MPANVSKGVKGFTKIPLEQRFWSRVWKTDYCWEWRGANALGYGQIWANGKCRKASQISWEIHHKKEWPQGMYACHTCDNPSCVHPLHIFPGTAADNTHDAMRKNRLTPFPNRANLTHCKHGHEFTESNTRITKRGHRDCIACKTRRNRLRYAQPQEAK